MRFLKWEMGERPKVNAYLLKTDVISNRYVFMGKRIDFLDFWILMYDCPDIKSRCNAADNGSARDSGNQLPEVALMCPILPARHGFRPYTIQNTNKKSSTIGY